MSGAGYTPPVLAITLSRAFLKTKSRPNLVPSSTFCEPCQLAGTSASSNLEQQRNALGLAVGHQRAVGELLGGQHGGKLEGGGVRHLIDNLRL